MFSAEFAVLFNRKFEELVPLTFFYIILVLYISGFMGSLLYGRYFLLISVPALGGFAIWKARKDWKKATEVILTPGFFFFFICAVGMLPWIMNKHTSVWDEFDHWALSVKNLFYFNRFSNGVSDSELFVSYPPAAALLAYFVQKLGRNYAECKTYLAYDLFYIGLLVPVFSCINRKDSKNNYSYILRILGVVFCVLLIPVVLEESTYDIAYVDMLIGICAATLLYIYFMMPYSKAKVLSIATGAAVLSLMKEYGVGFAVAAVGTIGICEVWNFVKKHEKRELIQGIVECGTAMAMLLTAKMAWNYYLAIVASGKEQELSEIFRGSSYDTKTIFNNFINTFITKKMGVGILQMPCAGWFVLSVLLTVMIWMFFRKNQENNIKIIGLGILNLGFVGYLGMLLLSYQTLFSSEGGYEITSFNRYSGSYIIMLFSLEILFLLSVQFKGIALLITVMVIALVSHLPLFKEIITARPINSERYEKQDIDIRFQRLATDIDQLGEGTKKIYFIHQGDSGYWYFVANYGVTPNQMQKRHMPWGLGEGRENDMTPEEWSDYLVENEFECVFINHADEQFQKNYGRLFENREIEEATLYDVKSAEGKISLVPVPGFSY